MIEDPKRGLIYNPEQHESCVHIRAANCVGLCDDPKNYVPKKCCAHPRHRKDSLKEICVPVEAEGPKCEYWESRSLKNLGD